VGNFLRFVLKTEKSRIAMLAKLFSEWAFCKEIQKLFALHGKIGVKSGKFSALCVEKLRIAMLAKLFSE
jgi:hypothetical protein